MVSLSSRHFRAALTCFDAVSFEERRARLASLVQDIPGYVSDSSSARSAIADPDPCRAN